MCLVYYCMVSIVCRWYVFLLPRPRVTNCWPGTWLSETFTSWSTWSRYNVPQHWYTVQYREDHRVMNYMVCWCYTKRLKCDCSMWVVQSLSQCENLKKKAVVPGCLSCSKHPLSPLIITSITSSTQTQELIGYPLPRISVPTSNHVLFLFF